MLQKTSLGPVVSISSPQEHQPSHLGQRTPQRTRSRGAEAQQTLPLPHPLGLGVHCLSKLEWWLFPGLTAIWCCVLHPSPLSFLVERWHMHLTAPQTHQQPFPTVPVVQFPPGTIYYSCSSLDHHSGRGRAQELMA